MYVPGLFCKPLPKIVVPNTQFYKASHTQNSQTEAACNGCFVLFDYTEKKEHAKDKGFGKTSVADPGGGGGTRAPRAGQKKKKRKKEEEKEKKIGPGIRQVRPPQHDV